MSNKTIFTLESRENSYLEVTKEYFKLSDRQMYDVIQEAFNHFIENLHSKKRIEYKNLRNVLTPNINKNEIALVFDSSKINSGWYGYEVFENVIPIFDKKTKHSILSGDLFLENSFLKMKFLREIKTIKLEEVFRLNNYYIVYVNNISNTLFKKFNDELSSYNPYIGYIDTSHQSDFKTILSFILCKIGIINEKEVILPYEDEDWETNENTQGLPFDKNNFVIKSVPSLYYDLFLSYKIEREDIKGYSLDTQIAINSITPIVTDLSNLNIEIEVSKFDYLLTKKIGKLKKAQFENYSIKDFEKLIKQKIKDNYIYEMSELKEHNVIKFNVIIELDVQYSKERVKCQATLHYQPEEKKLKLITFF